MNDTPNQVNQDASATGQNFPPNIPVASPSDFFPPSDPVVPIKKGSRGKIIATILGLMLLVGGLGAGVVLVNQPQLLEQRASDTTYAQCYSNQTQCVDANTVRVCVGGVWNTSPCSLGCDLNTNTCLKSCEDRTYCGYYGSGLTSSTIGAVACATSSYTKDLCCSAKTPRFNPRKNTCVK